MPRIINSSLLSKKPLLDPVWWFIVYYTNNHNYEPRGSSINRDCFNFYKYEVFLIEYWYWTQNQQISSIIDTTSTKGIDKLYRPATKYNKMTVQALVQ